MGREGVAEALRRLDDDAVREHAVGGDLNDLADLDLDEDEQNLVADAARDYPEVAGFAFSAFSQQGLLLPAVQHEGIKGSAPLANKAYLAAFRYAMGDGSV